MLPNGWQYKQFGELAEFKNGLNFAATARGAGLKLVGVGDFKDRLRITTDELEEVGGFEDINSNYLLKDHDLLFVRSNGSKALIGRVLYFDEVSGRVSHSGFTIRARFEDDPSLSQYVAQFFHADMARAQFQRLGGGTNISNLSQDMLAQIEIPLPPLPQRKRLLAILDTWDIAENVLQVQLTAKRELKKGLMQQLLAGQRRFPEFADQPWDEHHLGDLFTERNETDRHDLPLLAITGTRGVIHRDDLERKDSSNADKSKYKRIAPGDIGYNTMRMWQGVSALSELEGIVSPAYTICIPGKGINTQFAQHLFKFPPVVNRFYRYSQGMTSDTWNLKFHNFAQVKVHIPRLPEQQRIAEVLNAADCEIALLTKELEAVKTQKKGLMQQLLTGKKRVPVDSITTETITPAFRRSTT